MITIEAYLRSFQQIVFAAQMLRTHSKTTIYSCRVILHQKFIADNNLEIVIASEIRKFGDINMNVADRYMLGRLSLTVTNSLL